MKKAVKKKVEEENDSPHSTDLLKRVRISYLLTSGLVIVFAVSYGYLEYYYINDPVLGKTANLTVKGGTHRVATPIIGGLYSYHIYPMMVIFILVRFGSFFDSVSFNILGRNSIKRVLGDLIPCTADHHADYLSSKKLVKCDALFYGLKEG
jgi:hypothetical protein